MTTTPNTLHQYQNVAFSTEENTSDPGTYTNYPQGTTAIPIEYEESTNTHNYPPEYTSQLESTESTCIIMEPEGSTFPPSNPQTSTSIPMDQHDSTSISIESGGSPRTSHSSLVDDPITRNIELQAETTFSTNVNPNEAPPQPSSSSSPVLPNAQTPTTPITQVPWANTTSGDPSAPPAITRHQHPPNLVLSGHNDPNMYPIAENDMDVTAPPPPYWSVNPANDILASPSLTVRTQPPVSDDDDTLSSAPPPSYHTLYHTEPPGGDVTPQTPQTPPTQPSSNQAQEVLGPKEKRVLWFYIFIIGLVIPTFMVILKIEAKCPAKKQMLEAFVPGIIFHVLHGLTTVFTNGKLLPWRNRSTDCFIFFIFGWNIAMSVMVYGLGRNEDCGEVLYYFVFCQATLYNILFGVILSYLCIGPLLMVLKQKLLASCSEN